MDDITLILVVLVIAIGSLVGIAYLLQKRTKAPNDARNAQTNLGATSRKFLWVIRGIVALLVVLVLCTFIFRNLTFLWIALGVLIIYYLIGIVFRILRFNDLTKKQN